MKVYLFLNYVTFENRSQGLGHPAIEDLYEDPALHNEIDIDAREEADYEHIGAAASPSFDINKA